MKKIYMKPAMEVVMLQDQSQLLAGSGATQSLGGNNPEEFILDSDDLDDDDVLR